MSYAWPRTSPAVSGMCLFKYRGVVDPLELIEIRVFNIFFVCRGCTLFISFEASDVHRKISTIKCDPQTVSTFELYLTLKQDSSSWHSLLPQFLKYVSLCCMLCDSTKWTELMVWLLFVICRNLTRGGTIVISPGFTLEKKKLYRSYQDQ